MSEWSTAARQAKNEYMSEWRKKNRAKVQESQRRYWERVATKKKQAVSGS